MIKEFLDMKYGKNNWQKNLNKTTQDGILTATCINNIIKIYPTSPSIGTGDLTIKVSDFSDDIIEGDIRIHWTVGDTFIDPNKTLRENVYNEVIVEILNNCEEITFECSAIGHIKYELRIGRGYHFKYCYISTIDEFFINLEEYVTDKNLKKNENIKDIRKFAWALSSLNSVKRYKNMRYNIHVSGINIKDNDILRVIAEDNFNDQIDNVESIIFEDCVININNPTVINLFSRGTNIIYKSSDIINKEFAV